MATADILKNPFEFESQAKATEGKAGMAGVNGPVRRSTAGTGLRVGVASADLPATDEVMAVTARRDEQPFFAYAPPPRVRPTQQNYARSKGQSRRGDNSTINANIEGSRR